MKIEVSICLTNARYYKSLVEGFIYLTHTQLDITFFVGVVSRFMYSPSKHHLGTVKRILRYVAGTTDYDIWYSHNFKCKLFGFTNSDWVEALDDKKSTSSNIF